MPPRGRELPFNRRAARRPRPPLLRRGAGEVALAAADEEAREAARRLNLDLDLVPLAVVGEGRGAVADGVLRPELERDALEGVVHLGARRGEERLAARDAGQLFEDGAAAVAERRVVARADDADGVDDDIRLLEERSEEHTSELQSRLQLVCRLLLEKKKRIGIWYATAAV